MKLCLSLIFLLLGGCSSAQSVSDVRFNLNQIYRAVEATLTMGVAQREDHNQTFISKPFKIKKDEDFEDDKKANSEYRERGIARVFVLGLEQPYKVEVEVDIERGYYDDKNKEDKHLNYSHDHYDKRLATIILGSIRDYLNNRESNKNFIDDFRPF